jgi:hypothetical protein
VAAYRVQAGEIQAAWAETGAFYGAHMIPHRHFPSNSRAFAEIASFMFLNVNG